MGPAVFPITVLVDTNEVQHGFPYAFAALCADETRHPGGGPLTVRTEPCNLTWGDYSLEGFGDSLTVERKTLPDLFSTVTHGRERFVAEMEALATYQHAFVVVEAHEDDIFLRPPSGSPGGGPDPKSVHRSVLAFRVRYRTVQWVFAGSRAFGEKVTFRLLEKAWEETFPKKERRKIRY